MARSSSLQRHLDRAVGVPAVKALRLTQKRRPLPGDPRCIVVIQPTAIGDAILSSGVIARLARRHPQAALWVLQGASNAAAVAMVDAPIRTQTVPFNRPHKAVAALRALKPDLVVDLTPWPRATALAAQLSGAVSVGFDSENQHRAAAFDCPVPHACARHEIENFAALADVVTGPGPYALALKRGWPAPEPAFDWAKLALVHVNPGGSQAAAKSWPAAHWAVVLRALVDKGLQVGLTGVKADAAAVDAVLAAAGLPEAQARSLVGAWSLPALAGALERARLVLSVDTGVMHLAAALDAPLVALHGPTRPSRWGPVSPHAEAVASPHAAAGYINFGFEDHPEAAAVMPALTPEAVLLAVDRVLAKPYGGPNSPR